MSSYSYLPVKLKSVSSLVNTTSLVAFTLYILLKIPCNPYSKSPKNSSPPQNAMSKRNNDLEVPFPTYAKFLVGGTAGMLAAFCVHPMDFIKTRMQMSGEDSRKKLYSTSGDALTKIIRQEGVLAIYKGATACLMRHAVYATILFGMYSTLFGWYSENGENPPFHMKAMYGMLSGICAGFICTPLDICLVRMITDGAKPINQQYKYRNAFNALVRLHREEGGIVGLYKTGVPSTVRGMAVSGCLLMSYSQAKEFFIKQGQTEDIGMHFYCSVISGFLTSVLSLPADILKTRAQARRAGEPRQRIGEIYLSILRQEGALAFWKGLTPFFWRFTPVSVLSFIFIENMTQYYQYYILGNETFKSNL